jgi:adenylate cyclase
MFARALEIDPGYAEAHAGIADCDAFLWITGDLDVTKEDILANSTKALKLAPNLSEAHASMGLALYLSGQSDKAVTSFERAIELDPTLFAAHLFYGDSCRDTGHLDKAASLFARAADLLPVDYSSLSLLADTYQALGLREQCVSTARRCMARIEAEIGRRPENALATSFGAATLVYLGENARAEEWARRALSLEPDTLVVRYNVGCTYAVIGKPDVALEHVEYIFSHVPRARPWLLGIMSHDSQWASLRDRPDFCEFMKRLEVAVAENP